MWALKRNCIAVAVEKNLLTVAMSDPLLFTLVQDLEFQTGYRIKQVVATRGEIIDAIQTWYPDKALTRVSTGIQKRARDEGQQSRGGMLAPREGMLAPRMPDSARPVREEDIFE